MIGIVDTGSLKLEINSTKRIVVLDAYMEIKKKKDYLISIRKGNVSLKDIISKAEDDINRLDELFITSNLPEKSIKTSLIIYYWS